MSRFKIQHRRQVTWMADGFAMEDLALELAKDGCRVTVTDTQRESSGMPGAVYRWRVRQGQLIACGAHPEDEGQRSNRRSAVAHLLEEGR
jgi:hypothetical protein